ncbi:MAG: M23 family metallopeptidase [Candidatus Kaiserbacteria bacterium]|nr:M23 family metallopeptidase [Candidatus Kaiserbacteria bacterium]MCB9816522.1 M23 family metallopeptidase [Candidatus Nomurabacteria bacterium]
MFLSLVIAVPLSVQAGFFSKLFGEPAEAAPAVTAPTVSASDVPLLAALQNPNPLGARGGAEILVDENVLVSTGPVGEDEIAEQKNGMGEIRVYTVREGDSLSQIAEMFGVTTNTIMWANDISKASSIQPGDTLVILPIVGVRHVVKSGDTIGSIAKKYEGDVDEILSYNQLASAEELSVGDTLIIPGGAMHAAPVRASAASPVRVSGGGSASSAGFSHPVPGAVKTQGIHGYNAVDLAAGYGTPIRAAAAGEVIVSKSSGWNGGYGQYVVIRHANGAQTLYAHMMRNDVGVGAWVSQGEVIGGMGSTGKSTGTHLHFEVRGASNPF